MARWKIVPYPEEISLKQVSYGSEADIWGVTTEGKIYQFSEGAWRNIRGPMAGGVEKVCQWISVAIGGKVWCTTKDNSIFRYVGVAGWTIITTGKLSQLSIAPGIVWGVINGGVYELTESDTFRKHDQSLKFVSVGTDGKVWGIYYDESDPPNYAIYRRDGTEWIDIPGPKLKQISVGSASEVWGIDGNGVIYKYSGDDLNPWNEILRSVYKFSEDGGWSEEIAIIKQISVGSDGTVWGIAEPSIVGRKNHVISNYYLKDSHLLVSAPEIDEVRLEQGDSATYKFTVTNISSGAKLTEIDLELNYDGFENIDIITQEENETQFPQIAELDPGESAVLTFTIKAYQEADFKTYWFNCIEATYKIVPDKQPARLPVTGDIKGFMSFEVVKD